MIRLFCVGKMKDRRLADLVSDFTRRISGLAPCQVLEIRDSQPDQEARDLLVKLKAQAGGSMVVAWDELGAEITSRGLAELLGRHGSLSFLIGGADGLGADARQRADRILKLSDLTLTHEMARLLVVEQIYRGLCILRNKPYHRG
jgi:23S rRNA (pseudouridine1915-N3)-methyltransferase